MQKRQQRETCYSIYDDKAKTWTPWKILVMPDLPSFMPPCGSVQRVDLANGDILLPIYFKGKEDPFDRVTVARCTFDGTTLKYVEHGDEFELNSGRGRIQLVAHPLRKEILPHDAE